MLNLNVAINLRHKKTENKTLVILQVILWLSYLFLSFLSSSPLAFTSWPLFGRQWVHYQSSSSSSSSSSSHSQSSSDIVITSNIGRQTT
jgi:hypothetical protein